MMTFWKSLSAGLVHPTVTCASPPVAFAPAVPAGEALSMVMVELPESVPAWGLVLVKAVTVPATAYDPPGGAGIEVWEIAVIFILNCVFVVDTGIPQPVSVAVSPDGVALQYVPVSPWLVIATVATRAPVPAARVTVAPVTVSAPALVASPNESTSADAPGA